MSVTRFCCIRHGETAWNAERRLQGQIDIGLNAVGVTQAQAVGRWLAKQGGIEVLYASDLSRAWGTAECIGAALGLTPRPAPELRERRYGIFEGQTYDDAKQLYPESYAAFELRDPDYVFPGGGESLTQFHGRVTAHLTALAEAHPGQTLAVVLHGGVLDIINRFVRRHPLHTPRDFLIPNGGLNWIVRDGRGWHIVSWGETEHLAGVALDELK